MALLLAVVVGQQVRAEAGTADVKGSVYVLKGWEEQLLAEEGGAGEEAIVGGGVEMADPGQCCCLRGWKSMQHMCWWLSGSFDLLLEIRTVTGSRYTLRPPAGHLVVQLLILRCTIRAY